VWPLACAWTDMEKSILINNIYYDINMKQFQLIMPHRCFRKTLHPYKHAFGLYYDIYMGLRGYTSARHRWTSDAMGFQFWMFWPCGSSTFRSTKQSACYARQWDTQMHIANQIPHLVMKKVVLRASRWIRLLRIRTCLKRRVPIPDTPMYRN
jgi:hypothetical protein